MSRYVDIEPYKRDGWSLIRNYTDQHTAYIEGADLDTIPTADVEEVKHGRWVRITEKEYSMQEYMCSVCGRTIHYYGAFSLLTVRYPYCHCGAKMDEVEENDSR